MDCYKKKINNPFLSKQKKRKKFQFIRKIPLRAKLTFMACLLLLTGIIWFLVFCPVWNIDRINVKGADRIASDDIKKIAQETTKNEESLIFLNTEEVKKTINKEFRLKELSIEKKWPNTLLINIKEEPYAYIWLEDDHYYYSDINGFILKDVNKKEYTDNKGDKKNDLPLIVNKTKKKIKERRIDMEKDHIKFILDLYDEFGKNYVEDIELDKFIISSEVDKVTALLKKGPEIYFTASKTPEEQIHNLLVIKEQKIKKDFENKEYIDIRYGDKVYYQ